MKRSVFSRRMPAQRIAALRASVDDCLLGCRSLADIVQSGGNLLA
jgi:hypothetical protein